MATDNLKNVFLSASIPLAERNPRYYETADNIAIRDAVNALATVVLPKARLIWGGHPTITPMIRFAMKSLGIDSSHMRIYQSKYFIESFPSDNNAFNDIIVTDSVDDDREKSLELMRKEMLVGNDFVAGIFIGGMEGVEDEYKRFCESHPDTMVLPIASTGAAAQILYNRYKEEKHFNPALKRDYAYMALFRRLLKNQLGDL